MNLRKRIVLATLLSALTIGLFGSITGPSDPIAGVLPEHLARIDAVSRETGIPRDRVKITLWRPDTCDCELEFAWDRATIDKPESRVHYPVSVKACSLHGGRKFVGRKASGAPFDTVLTENQQKNRAVGELSVQSGVPADNIQWAVDSRRHFTASLPNRSGATVAIAK